MLPGRIPVTEPTRFSTPQVFTAKTNADGYVKVDPNCETFGQAGSLTMSIGDFVAAGLVIAGHLGMTRSGSRRFNDERSSSPTFCPVGYPFEVGDDERPPYVGY